MEEERKESTFERQGGRGGRGSWLSKAAVSTFSFSLLPHRTLFFLVLGDLSPRLFGPLLSVKKPGLFLASQASRRPSWVSFTCLFVSEHRRVERERERDGQRRRRDGGAGWHSACTFF